MAGRGSRPLRTSHRYSISPLRRRPAWARLDVLPFAALYASLVLIERLGAGPESWAASLGLPPPPGGPVPPPPPSSPSP